MAISTGGDVTITAGSLPSNFCHTSWQSTLNNFVSSTDVAFTNGALFAAGTTAPTSTDRLWCKLDSSDNVLGWYWYDAPEWVPVPVPLVSALPNPSAVTTETTYGDADKHVTVTIGEDGYVTGVAEVTPTAIAEKGLAKAWMKFTTSAGGTTPASAYNCAATRTGTGVYEVLTATTVTFSSSPIVICSYDGITWSEDASESSNTTSVTVRPAISVESSVGTASRGKALLKVYRADSDGEDATDGDLNWTETAHDGNAINVVFFGD